MVIAKVTKKRCFARNILLRAQLFRNFGLGPLLQEKKLYYRNERVRVFPMCVIIRR